MAKSLAAEIRAAHTALFTDGDLDAVERFFAPATSHLSPTTSCGVVLWRSAASSKRSFTGLS